MEFPDRLRRAAAHAKVPWSPTEIGKSLARSKQTVGQWMKGTNPRTEELFQIEARWGVSARWLATEAGPMLARPASADEGGLTPEERLLVENYRAADPRWRLSLRLLAALANEDQIEAATDVNVIVARILGMKPKDIHYPPDTEVGRKIGKAPHVKEREERLARSKARR